MPASVGYLVIDATEPERLARFWCGLLDVGVETTIGDGQFIVLSATKDGLTVGFQRVTEGKAGKNRLHLDLIVGDLDQATAEVETLGGRWSSRAAPASWKVSGGGAWPTRRATSSTSTYCPEDDRPEGDRPEDDRPIARAPAADVDSGGQCLLAADEAEGAGPADRLVPGVDAEPLIQPCRSLLGCRPGDAQLVGDHGEGQWFGEVPENLSLGHGD